MNEFPLKPKPEKAAEPRQIIRGEQANTPLNAVIVGGGDACHSLLELQYKDQESSRLNMKILGVADINADAPGLVYAKQSGLYTTPDFRYLFELEGLNLIIELTGSTKLRENLMNTKPKIPPP